MNLLLDTHVILWMVSSEGGLSPQGNDLVQDPENKLWFSVVTLWEVTIKRTLDRPDFRTEARVLRAGLLRNGFQEIAVEGRHCLALADLPLLHSDPFDRLLIAQAMSEGMQLVTADRKVAAYDGPIVKV